MGGVGERPASRPLSMWIEMSQYIPKTAVSSETVATAEGKATQPGMPEMRSLWSARRWRI